ncbi:MAG: beta-ketoacyl synthase N-terminal-like domain-containing protein, partial [Parvularculaceae bacterium]
MRRAVITGLGLVSPLASGAEASWRRLVAGESAAGPIDAFDATGYACRVAAPVPRRSGRGGGKAMIDAGFEEETFDADAWVSPKDQRRMDDFIQFGIAAGALALQDAGREFKTAEEKERAGVMVGAGIG